MRIQKIDFHMGGCDGDCPKRYCRYCRTIYRECQTWLATLQGDRDVPGGLKPIYMSNEKCPECSK